MLVGLRRRLSFSQQQLAAKVGAASKAVVYQWESGKRKPSPVFWLRIKWMQPWRRLSNHCLMSERVHTLFRWRSRRRDSC